MRSSQTSENGKKELLELLERGGLRHSDDTLERLQQQIWFANEIVATTIGHTQKFFWIPKDFQDEWTGPTRFCIAKALRHADVTPEEFDRHWKAKVEQCRKTKKGKKELVRLLTKGGLRQCDSGPRKLERQVWLINEVVGRNAFEQDIQKQIWIPGYLRDMWDGPPKFMHCKALRLAGITANQFYDCWKAKVESCECSESGKKELLQLLEKGGVRTCNGAMEQLQQQLWLVNQIAGGTSPALKTTVTYKACIMRAYLSVYT